jgi:endonuclease/exonuclease/phosphatase family metal-dependent hydrolase
MSSGLMKTRMLEQLVKSQTLSETAPLMVVTGDFNCEPNSAELLAMFKPVHDLEHNLDISLRYTKLEAQRRKGPDVTFTGFDFKSNGKIDYIFYQDGWKGERSYKVPLYQVIADVLPGGYAPSDHRPVQSLIGGSDILTHEEDDFIIIEAGSSCISNKEN